MSSAIKSIINFLGNLSKQPDSKEFNCLFHPTTCFYPSARVNNLLGEKAAIRLGMHNHIRGELVTFAHGGDLSIGDYCYVGEGARIWSALKISICDRVLISHNVNIFDNDTHPIDDYRARHEQFKKIITDGHPTEIDLNEKEIYIESDVLICCQAIILPGVHIGRGAVIAAGSVVTKDIPDFKLVAGNPAKIMRDLPQ